MSHLFNNFDRKVAPLFKFLLERGYREVSHSVSDSFDDGQLIYESPLLHITIWRDRGHVAFEVRELRGYRAIGEQTLRKMILGRDAAPELVWPDAHPYERSSNFLSEQLATIEALFAPDRVEESLRENDALVNEWLVAKGWGPTRKRPK